MKKALSSRGTLEKVSRQTAQAKKKSSAGKEMHRKRKQHSMKLEAGNSILDKMAADIRAWAGAKLESLQRMDLQRLLLLNAPYAVAVYLFDKSAWLYRRCSGESTVAKMGALFLNFSAAIENPFPSMHHRDLLIGVAGAVLVKTTVYLKGKNAKKYRHGEEYGSARWGTPKDIAPFIDPVYDNNILLTQTERLTMDSRPKQPKYARNKNVIVIGAGVIIGLSRMADRTGTVHV